MIDDKKSLAIDLLIPGDLTKEEIAKRCGRTRQWVYQQVINNEECKAELAARLQAIKNQAEVKFNGKLDLAIDQLWQIINSNVDVRTRERAIEYWIDKTMGKNTARVEVTDTTDKDNDGVEDILKDYNKFIEMKNAQ